MILFNSILTLILSFHLSSAIPRSKNELALELKIPKFINALFGIDDSVQTFRATVGSLKPKSNDLTFAFSTNNNSDSGNGIHKRAKSQENKVVKVNIKGVNEAAAVFRSILQPFNPNEATEDIFSTIMDLMRRSTKETRPKVVYGPGIIKSELINYPPKYFEDRLKNLVKLKQKEEEKNRQLKKA